MYDISEIPFNLKKNKAESARLDKHWKNTKGNAWRAPRILATRVHTNPSARKSQPQSVEAAFAELGFSDPTEYVEEDRWACSACTFDNTDGSHCAICEHPRQRTTSSSRSAPTMVAFIDPETIAQLETTTAWETDLDESLQTAILESLTTSEEKRDFPLPTQAKISAVSVRKKKLDGHATFASYWNESRTFSEMTQVDELRSVQRHSKQRNKSTRAQKSRGLVMYRKMKDEKQSSSKKKLRRRRQSRFKRLEDARMAKLDKALPSPNLLISGFQETYTTHGNPSIERVASGRTMKRFGSLSRNTSLVYHGTAAENVKSIAKMGLVPGGTNGISIRNGSAYGHGVYCSPQLETAMCYARGAVFVCLAKGCSTFGSIHVAPSAANILACYVIRFPLATRRQYSAIARGGAAQGSSFSKSKKRPPFLSGVVQILPRHALSGPNNSYSTSRNARRRFSNRDSG